MGDIYTNLAASWYVPGIYVNVELGRGTPSAALQSRRVLLVGNKLPNYEPTPPAEWQNPFFPPMGSNPTPEVGNKEYKYRYSVSTEDNPAGTDDGKIYPIPSLLMAAARFGYGSELYIMAKAAFEANPTVDLYGIVQEIAPAVEKAELDVTVAGPATGNGELTITVLGQECSVDVETGDPAVDIAAAIVSAFNDLDPETPFLATKADAVVTFTAKEAGTIWNGVEFSLDSGTTGVTLTPVPSDRKTAGGTDAPYSDLSVTTSGPATKDGVIRIDVLDETCTIRVKEDDIATAVAEKIRTAFNAQLRDLPFHAEPVTSPSAVVRFKAKHPGEIWNGVEFSATVEVDGITLAPLSDETDGGAGLPILETGALEKDGPADKSRYHYVAIPYNDEDNLAALVNYLERQALPEVGLRQQGLFGANGTFDQAISSFADACTCPRVQCVWAANSTYFPGQLAAATAATRQLWEGGDPAVNLCLKEVVGVPMTVDEDLLTITQKNKALLEGITPLIPAGGRMVILRSVTCAANFDLAQVVDTGKVTVSDFVADDVEIKMAARYKGFKLSPDTDIPLPSRVTTPGGIKQSLLEWLRALEKKGVITRVTELAPGIKVEIDTEVPGRVNFEIPEDVVDIFAVGAGNLVQIG